MIGVIVQARTGSTRLPRKVLMEIPPKSGVTVLEWVFNRLSKSKLANVIVMTTPDIELCEFANKIKMNWMWNVTNRNILLEYLLTAREYKIDNIVRVTADCPLIDPEIVDEVIREHIKHDNDYTYNRCDDNGGGDGLDVEVFKLESLEKLSNDNPTDYEKEHVTAGFRVRREDFRIETIGAPDFEGCSLDTKDDYDKISEYMIKYEL